MIVTCPSCGTENRKEARFCHKCGAPLSQPQVSSAPATPAVQASAPEPVPPAPGPLPEEETGAGVPAAAQSEASDVTLSAMDVAGAATIQIAPDPPFAALPEGALLDNRRYQIMAVLPGGTSSFQAYEVLDLRHRYCTQCGAAESGTGDEYCSNCGRAFPETPAPLWLRESAKAEMWERQKQMAAHKLWHPGLVNVYHVFHEPPYGSQSRAYLVSDADGGGSLAHLPDPPSEERVLAWAVQLADALEYLHSKGFRHRTINAASVRLAGDSVKLTNFARAERVPVAEPKGWPAQEVLDLARLLRDELLAGQQLSPATVAIFEKALSPDQSSRYASASAFAHDLTAAAEALHRVDSIALLVGRLSHVGEVRDHNEDSLLTLELQRTLLSESQPVGLYIVADGMGGHEAGEVASGLAIHTAAKVLVDKLFKPQLDGAAPPDFSGLVEDAFQKANLAVHERGRKARADMGTTLVGALVAGSEAFVANIGDSRCYRINRAGITQVTTDHSLVQRLIDSGQITPEEARVHPQRNYIYRTVGDRPKVEVDVFTVSLKPGDYLLLCSDGLSGMVEDAKLQEVVLENDNPQAACEQLIQLANVAGGDDNITAIVVQVVAAIGHREQARNLP